MVGDNWGATTFEQPLGLEEIEKIIDKIIDQQSVIMPQVLSLFLLF